MQQVAVASAPPKAISRGSNLGDLIFAGLTRSAGVLVLILLGAIIIELFIGGLPAFQKFGFPFLTSTDWDPVQEEFGAAVSIFGTVTTAVLALMLSVPIAFGIAFYLTELAPQWLRRPLPNGKAGGRRSRTRAPPTCACARAQRAVGKEGTDAQPLPLLRVVSCVAPAPTHPPPSPPRPYTWIFVLSCIVSRRFGESGLWCAHETH